MKKYTYIFIIFLALCGFNWQEGETLECTVDKCPGTFELARMTQGVLGASGGASAGGHCDDGTHDGAGNAITLCEDAEGSTNCAGSADAYCRQTFSYALGSITWNDTTPTIEGTRTITTNGEALIRKDFTAADNQYVYMLYQWNASVGRAFLDMYTESTPLCRISVTSGGNLVANGYGGSGGVTSVSAMTKDTTYSIWAGYEKGTGANAKCFACFSSSAASKPGARTDNNCANSTDGTATTQVSRIEWGTGTGSGNTSSFDHIRVNGTEQGASPE